MHKPKEDGKYLCTKCKQTKSLSEFYLDSRKKSGVASWCKACSLATARRAAKERQKKKQDAINSLMH